LGLIFRCSRIDRELNCEDPFVELEVAVILSLLAAAMRSYYDFHFRAWKARYTYFGVTCLLVFIFGIWRHVLLGNAPSSVAFQGAILGVFVLALGPVVQFLVAPLFAELRQRLSINWWESDSSDLASRLAMLRSLPTGEGVVLLSGMLTDVSLRSSDLRVRYLVLADTHGIPLPSDTSGVRPRADVVQTARARLFRRVGVASVLMAGVVPAVLGTLSLPSGVPRLVVFFGSLALTFLFSRVASMVILLATEADVRILSSITILGRLVKISCSLLVISVAGVLCLRFLDARFLALLPLLVMVLELSAVTLAGVCNAASVVYSWSSRLEVEYEALGKERDAIQRALTDARERLERSNQLAGEDTPEPGKRGLLP
jgi:hypothetical protein